MLEASCDLLLNCIFDILKTTVVPTETFVTLL